MITYRGFIIQTCSDGGWEWASERYATRPVHGFEPNVIAAIEAVDAWYAAQARTLEGV